MAKKLINTNYTEIQNAFSELARETRINNAVIEVLKTISLSEAEETPHMSKLYMGLGMSEKMEVLSRLRNCLGPAIQVNAYDRDSYTFVRRQKSIPYSPEGQEEYIVKQLANAAKKGADLL